MSAPLPATPASGWQAELVLGFTQRGDKTVLAERRQRGPLAIQRPFYPDGSICHAYVLHPPGGVVGGDQLRIDLNIASAAHALLTTPGATKFYRSSGQQATQKQTFTVAGTLEWLPQENIFFPGTNSRLDTEIHLNEQASYIGWEVQCLGRPVIAERFEHGCVLFNTKLYRNRKPLFIDRLSIKQEADLHGPAGLRNQPVMATLLATCAASQTLQEALELTRTCCETPLSQGYAGVTRLNEVLVVRYLGSSTAEAHRLLRNIWSLIRPLITGHAATPPRIWNT